MPESAQQKTVQDIYAAFGRGDIPFIVQQLADDVRWVTHFDPIVPWAGNYDGVRNVPRFFTALGDAVDVEEFEPRDYVTQGNTVVSDGEFACRSKKTGKRVRTRWVFIWKFSGGRVSSYEQFHDPAIAGIFQ